MEQPTRRWLMLSGSLFLFVLALHFWLVWGGSFPGDMWAIRRGWFPHSTAVQDYANAFADLATPGVAILIVAVQAGALLARRRLGEFNGLIVACCVIPFNALCKLTFGPSPLWARFHPGSHNFPSGHVTFVTAVIGYLGLVSWRAGHRWATALAVLLIVGIGPARVVTGVHLVSDVVAGYCVGASFLILAYTCSQPRTLRPGVEPPLRQEDQ